MRIQITVIIVNYYSGRFTELLVKSILKLNADLDVSILVFDNGSTDGSLDFLQRESEQNISVTSAPNPYSSPSASHGFAIDMSLRHPFTENADFLCLMDSDCFSLKKNWLTNYVHRMAANGIDVLGAQAYCPEEKEKFRYLWPGFLILGSRARSMIRSNRWSFIPNRDTDCVNDSGQIVSILLHNSDLVIEYLDRTPPRKIGSVQLEKWSIDNTVDHFFAISMARRVRNPFLFIYGDRSRGSYLFKRIMSWRLFKQAPIRDLLSL